MITDEVVEVMCKAVSEYSDKDMEAIPWPYGWLTTELDQMRASTRAGLEAVVPMLRDGWLPMSIAPSTGEPVILGYAGSHSEEGFWMGDPTRNYWGETGWFSSDDNVLSTHPHEPDGWMPLPAAPKPDTEVQP